MKHQLNIPLMPQLDNLSLQEVANALEDGGARFSVESLNWPSAFPYRPPTVVTAAHTGRCLYLDFLVRCNYLRAVNYTDNSPVSEDSCVEFYVQPHPDSDLYFTFEFNCVGTLNSARCTSAGQCTHAGCGNSRHNPPVRFGGHTAFEEVEGSFIWSIVAAIPLDILGISYEGKPMSIKGNFNKCASATSQPHYLSWAPISTENPDFHQPQCFGEIILDA